MLQKYKIPISITIIWLFTISGIIGILLEDYKDWFLALTPLNLAITFIILLVNITKFKKTYIIALLIPFMLGFITEALGVNYGLVFGDYIYGNNLGYKIFGVPLMICINWVLLTAVTADIARCITKHLVIAALIGALLMTGVDLLLEVSAPRFDFWEFKNGIVPLQNYIGWLVTAFIAHLGYQYFKVKTHKVISWHILVSIVLFFTVFIFF